MGERYREVAAAVRRHGGRQSAAARELGIAPSTVSVAVLRARVDELREALQQDANLIHYGRHTKYPEEHSERFEDCTFLRCAARRTLLGPPESGDGG